MRMSDHHVFPLLCSAVALLIISGCERTPAPPTNVMTTDQIIQRYGQKPIGESIDLIAQSLRLQNVYVGTEDVASTKDGRIEGNLRLKTGKDNRGQPWVYAYTSETNFSIGLGGPFAEMRFMDVFKIADSDSRFGGIYLNPNLNGGYPIPREMFHHLRQAFQNR